MAAPPRKSTRVSYRFERCHAALRGGHGVTVQLKNHDPVHVFSGQGDLSGSCGLNLICMVLAIFGLAKPSALANMSSRRYGIAAQVWSAFGDSYFVGLHPVDLVTKF